MSITLNKDRSPFKFLDPYDSQDKDYFFGRNTEENMLYNYVNQNRLVLVYGQSGTGKTSLVQCGLSKRFDSTDWLPFYIRRGKDINDSLRTAVQQSKAIGGVLPYVEGETSIAQLMASLELISRRYMRPIYLIFDQFEELLILGGDKEKKEFLDNMAELVGSSGTHFCNFLFILREEYFAMLDIFEKRIKGFSDKRMRVEPMRPKEVYTVISDSCEHFHLRLQNPVEDTWLIVEAMTGKSGVSLPYLQVYLDQLWREAFAKAFPNRYEGDTYPELSVSTTRLKRSVKITNILERFMNERKIAIQTKLKMEWPAISNELVKNVLDAFVTDEGTKLPLPFTMADELVVMSDIAPQQLKDLQPELLTAVLKELEGNRLLRTDGETYELAHDLLAAIIDKQRSEPQRKLISARKMIGGGFELFRQSGDYLTLRQIALTEEVLSELRLTAQLKKFFEDSKKFHDDVARAQLKEALEEKEKERQQAEDQARTEREHASRERKLKNRSYWFIGLTFLLLGWSVYEYVNIKNTNSQLNKEQIREDSLYKEGQGLLFDRSVLVDTLQSTLRSLKNQKTVLEIAVWEKIRPQAYRLISNINAFSTERPSLADSIRTDLRRLLEKNSENDKVRNLRDSLMQKHVL